MTKRMNKVAVVVAAFMCVSLVACGIGADVYRYGDWPSDPALAIGDLNQEMIDTCGLTPADIVMIELSSQRFQKAFYGNTCDQIRAGLPGYRETNGIQLGSMVTNPAIDDNLPSTQGIQYALLSIGRPDSAISTQVFVDFHEDTVSFGKGITANMGEAITVALSAEQRVSVLADLEPLTGWVMPWTQTGQLSDDIGGFRVMVIAEDGVLYRWTAESPSINPNRTIPPDFMIVYETFMNLTKT